MLRREQTNERQQIGVGTNRPLLLAMLLSLGLHATLLTVPLMAAILKVVPLSLEDWWILMGAGVLPLPIMESIKWWRRFQSRRNGTMGPLDNRL